LNGCGTKRRYLESAIVYSNTITDQEGESNFISRSKKKLSVGFSCVYPRSAKASALGFTYNELLPSLRSAVTGFGQFRVYINLYENDKYEEALTSTEYPLEVAVQDRLYFEVKLDSDDPRLSVFAENCSVTPSQDKKDKRRYFLTRKGCKTDPTVQFHKSPLNAHRMSYESFTFIGVETSVTYLQCDVLICDVMSSDRRCIDRVCKKDNVGNARGKRRSGFQREIDTASRAVSGPVLVDQSKRSHRRSRRSVNVEKLDTASDEHFSLPALAIGISATAFIVLVSFVLYVRHRRQNSNDSSNNSPTAL
jgi:hypothetical protein